MFMCLVEGLYLPGLSQEAQDKWNTFVSGSLAEMNKQNTVELVSMVSIRSLRLCGVYASRDHVFMLYDIAHGLHGTSPTIVSLTTSPDRPM